MAGRKFAIIALAVVAGLFVASFSLAMTMSRKQPLLALQLAPYLADPMSRLASIMLLASTKTKDTAPAERFARDALAQNPFDARALGVLGHIQRASKNDAVADRLFDYAFRISRRETITGFDRIAQAAKRGETERAVQYFDISMRTNRNRWEALFPVMYQISGDPRARSALARVLSRDPQWKPYFLDGYARTARDPRGPAELLSALEALGPLRNDDLQKIVIGRLIEAGYYSEARKRYASFAAEKGIQGPDKGDFERPTLGLPFEWELAPDAALQIATSENATRKRLGRSFYFRVPDGQEGELLRSIRILDPGQHSLSLEVGPPLQGKVGDLSLTLECLGGSANVKGGTISAPAAGRHTMVFTVPPQCEAIRLYVRAAGAAVGRVSDEAWVSWLDNLII